MLAVYKPALFMQFLTEKLPSQPILVTGIISSTRFLSEYAGTLTKNLASSAEKR